MNKLSKGSCAQYHANAPRGVLPLDQVLEDAVADCGNGKKNCMDYTKWQQAWTRHQVARRRRPRPAFEGRPPPPLGRASGAGPGCAALALLLPPLALVRPALPRRARRAVRLGVLVASTRSPPRSSTRGTPTTSARSWTSPTYRRDRRAHGRDRGGSHRDRRGARVPVRVLHGADSRRRGCARCLFVLVLLPLWSSYLVRVYAWR